MKSTRIFAICFCSLLCLTAGVKISSLNRSSSIGPVCGQLDGEKEKCTLSKGTAGQCSLNCATPYNKDAGICCHTKSRYGLSVYFCCDRVSSDRFAVSGIRARRHEFPYMAALGWFRKEAYYLYKYNCGGAFISKKFVLTAAHCAYIDGIEPVVILPGGSNLKKDISSYPLTIETVHVHPEYDDDFVYYDIALIEIIGEYTGGIIELWRRPYIANTTFTAIGYGDTTFGGTSSDVLIKVFLDFVTTDDCQRFYEQQENVPTGIMNTQVCAKDPKNVMDTCQGDSGGPLIMTIYNKDGKGKKDYLFGITSFGQGCALSPPGVYTLASAFLDWVNGQVKTGNNTTTATRVNEQWAWQ